MLASIIIVAAEGAVEKMSSFAGIFGSSASQSCLGLGGISIIHEHRPYFIYPIYHLPPAFLR